MSKIIVTNIEHTKVEREANAILIETLSVSAFWTLSNGLVIQVHYFKTGGFCRTYKTISISPFMGYSDMPYTEVRNGLEHVMNAIQAWASCRHDKAEWEIYYSL